MFLKNNRPYSFNPYIALTYTFSKRYNKASSLLYSYLNLYDQAIGVVLLDDAIPFRKPTLSIDYADNHERIQVEQKSEDIKFCKNIAMFPNNDQQKRILFLQILNYTVQHNIISESLKLLKECDLLSVEDIINAIPDFNELGEWKDFINQTLELKIDQLNKLCVK